MSRQIRVMPTLKRVAEDNNLGKYPHCVRCGWYPAVGDWRHTTGYLDRAHVVDRCYGGSDCSANLRPLCHLCHRQQPIFVPQTAEAAFRWFEPTRREQHTQQLLNFLLVTKRFPPDCGSVRKMHRRLMAMSEEGARQTEASLREFYPARGWLWPQSS